MLSRVVRASWRLSMSDAATHLHDLGRRLLETGRAAEAEKALSEAAALRGGAWDVLCDLGTAQLQQGHSEAAIGSFAAALAVKPDAVIAHHNLGTALADIGAFDDAVRSWRAALRHDPSFRPAVVALANMLCDLGIEEEGRQLFALARALDPNDELLDQAIGLVDLRYGKLREGFAAYEARFLPGRFALPARPFTPPRWQGESLEGKRILVWTEQGLGEEILAASMFADVAAQAGSLVIECSDRLAPLLERALPQVQVVARRDPPDPAAREAFDYQSPALSLARYLRCDFSEFPRHQGYLNAAPTLSAHLRGRYRALAGGNRIVGISWESAARHGNRKRIPLEFWRPILDVPGVTFVSLQYGIGPESPHVAAADGKLFIDGEVDALKSLDAAAAQVAAMDLVITVSNTAAHLAGAQNVPVWTMTPSGPGCFWYWFRDRADSPWYPSMRLFRQPRPGAWLPVVADVARALL